jgi:hypothetical protein
MRLLIRFGVVVLGLSALSIDRAIGQWWGRCFFGMIQGLYAAGRIKDLSTILPANEHEALTASFDPFLNTIRALDQELIKN